MPERNNCSDFVLILISIFLPFLAVGLRRGFFTADFVINVALCLLGFIPGLVHAWYILAKYPSGSRYVEAESQPLLGP